MSLRSTMAFLLATQFLAADYAAASLGTDNFNSVTGQTGLLGFGQQADQALAKDKWYSVSKTITVGLLEQVGSNDNRNVGGNTLLLVEGTELSIMEISEDGRYALIGIDEDGFGENNSGVNEDDPVIAWVDIAELIQAEPQMVDTEALELFGDTDLTMSTEVEYATTEVAGKKKKPRKKAGRARAGKMTYCLRDVRLYAARFTKKVPQGIPMASMAYPAYKKAGWKPVKYGKSNPVGTACFMSGGRSCGKRKCGHAAIKISANAWKGAGVRPTPWLRNSKGKVYKQQGCLTPPGR